MSQVEVEDLLERLPTGKAPGYDSISGHCIKSVKQYIGAPLTTLVNRMFDEHLFPDPLKKADVTPVYKKENRLIKGNYRPVSVLISFSKVFEMAMSDQMDPHLKLIYHPLLSAYIKNIGCGSTLTYLLETWRRALDEDQYVGLVMMDLSKAFDCLPHNLLTNKLRYYNFDQGSCNLMHSYLTDRTQCVKIGAVRSSGGTLIKGVPQGSLIGPKAFNIFINDLLIVLSTLCTPGNYADDNTVCVMHKNFHTMLSRLKKACETAIEWFDNNLMKANPDKFNFMVLSPFQKEHKNVYTLRIADVILTSVLQAPLLGITFDTELTFKPHVQVLIQKANFQLYTLKRLCGFLDTRTKLTILKSFIRSNFTYCCHIWYFTLAVLKERLERLQHRGLKYAFNDYVSDYEVLLEKADMDPIYLLIQKAIVTDIYKAINNIGATYLQEFFVLSRNKRRRDLIVPRVDSTTYGLHSLRFHGAKLWSNLSSKAKNAKSVEDFKAALVDFKGVKCKCAMCKFTQVL